MTASVQSILQKFKYKVHYSEQHLVIRVWAAKNKHLNRPKISPELGLSFKLFTKVRVDSITW